MSISWRPPDYNCRPRFDTVGQQASFSLITGKWTSELDYDFCCLFEGKADEWEARRENIRMSIQEDDNNSAFHFCADSRQEMNFRLGVGHFNVPCAHHWHASHVLIR